DFAFKRAHARLARVAANDGAERVVVDRRLLGLEAVGFELPANEIAPRNFELFAFSVAAEAYDLHPVPQRTGNCFEHVAGRDENDPAQVERYAKVVVAEGVVLFRV